jgi:hypothetical protein
LASSIQLVIPGRALRASPESITPVFTFCIHTLAQGVWIPGLRQEAHRGMTKVDWRVALRKFLNSNFKQPSAGVLAPPRELGF